MKTISAYKLILVAIILIIASCKKDEVVGPQGPQGPTGATGATGNANIITIYDTTSSASWVVYGNNGQYFKTLINVPEITQEILDSGVVLVYLYSITGNSNYGWILLPYSTINIDWNTFYYLNTLEINWLSNYLFPPDPGIKILKIVIMPKALSIRESNSGLDFSDYEKVKEEFNLHE